jgi:hypothetical protein
MPITGLDLNSHLHPLHHHCHWWWFLKRERLPLTYYAGVGVAMTVIVVVPDYLFIVRLFKATTYYAPDVFLYYALIFLTPVGAAGTWTGQNR